MVGKDLGNFHSDFPEINHETPVAVESYFVGKKIYIDKLQNSKKDIGFHVRCKGVSLDAIIGAASRELLHVYSKIEEDRFKLKNAETYLSLNTHEKFVDLLYEATYLNGIDGDLEHVSLGILNKFFTELLVDRKQGAFSTACGYALMKLYKKLHSSDVTINFDLAETGRCFDYTNDFQVFNKEKFTRKLKCKSLAMTDRDFISQIRSQNEVQRITVTRPITYEFTMFTKRDAKLQETDKLTMKLLNDLALSVIDKDTNRCLKDCEYMETKKQILNLRTSWCSGNVFATRLEYTQMFMEVFRDDFLIHLYFDFDFDHTEESECVTKITKIVEY
jgi:hypothetical protein